MPQEVLRYPSTVADANPDTVYQAGASSLTGFSNTDADDGSNATFAHSLIASSTAARWGAQLWGFYSAPTLSGEFGEVPSPSARGDGGEIRLWSSSQAEAQIIYSASNNDVTFQMRTSTQNGTTEQSPGASRLASVTTSLTNVTAPIAAAAVNATVDEGHVTDLEVSVRSVRGINALQPATTFSLDYVRLRLFWTYELARIGTPTEGSAMSSGVQVEYVKDVTVDEGGDGISALRVEVDTRLGLMISGEEIASAQLTWALTTGVVIQGFEQLSGVSIQVYGLTVAIEEGMVPLIGAFAYTYTFAGITRREDGTRLGGCTVWLFETADPHEYRDVTTSDADGDYSFSLTSDPIEYFVRAHLDTDPDGNRVFGTSDRNLTVDEALYYSAPIEG